MTNTKPFHVYHLVDPTDKAVRYVGRCQDPKARLRNHCNEARRRQTTEKHRWINRLIQAGTMPVLVVVGVYADAAESRQREAEEWARFWLCRLCHGSSGPSNP